jgi:Ca2+-binding RTX toxin-like protein
MNVFENLEQRRLMSVTAFVELNTLWVEGDGGKNDLSVELFKKDGIDQYRVKEKGQTVKIKLSEVPGQPKVSNVPASATNALQLYGNGNDDKLTVSGTSSSGVYPLAFFHGGSGNDTIRPGKGKDSVDGGSGNDTIDYSKYDDAVEVYLDTTLPGASGRRWSTTDRDTLYSIENAKGGDGDDILWGNTGNNKLEGNDGSDQFVGGAGADILKGGDGDDHFQLLEFIVDYKDEVDGGNGYDYVDHAGFNDVIVADSIKFF